ncbi:DNA repair protein XRCC1 [Coccinella septempunctata]|uniref:DNA repair protein XRCC1 n=1 Tax=Coccinella septempunctata TaxID=41139 RepID=UPI001D0624BE|nr:DNA repair protein XRCC1 [Coccinella septempunctata]
MPPLKIDRILSFSSEDKVHVANNLLGNNTSLKWKCASPGEKQATLCFQLEEASVITGIDIGNEHSAYIEVLVSRSEMNGDYKSFLVMSSFMSAIESRQSTNINRVRMFKKSDFSKPECDEKWDRIKLVCTQPFNRHVQYGLSFIKFHSNEAKEKDNSSDNKLGKFTLRPESPVELGNGSLFARRKELEVDKDKPLTAAAAIRAATSSLLNDRNSTPVRSPKLLPNCLRNSTPKTKTKDASSLECSPKPRNRNELFYTEDEEKPNDKIDRLIEQKNAEKIKRIEESNKNTPQSKNKKRSESSDKIRNETEKKGKTPSKDEPSASKVEKESFKRKPQDVAENLPKKIKPAMLTKPFEKLLEDVVLVISGIQNPDRATLRGKILEMGAKYKPDWDNTCTHLVCAFMNTPKFNQVRGKGKIVTRKWVEECFSQRKKIPWRRYALDRQEKNKDESEDEIWEKIEDVRTVSPPIENERQDFGYDDDLIEPASDTEDIIEQIRASTSKNIQGDSKEREVISPEPTPHCSKKILDVTSKVTNSSVEVKEQTDIYSAETDTDEETAERKQQVKNKPFDFFKNKLFFIDTNFEDYIEEMLKNYVFIHEGSLVDDPTENADYLICGKEEAPNLSAVNTKAICVLPDWIFDCHKCRQFIPPDEYFVL